MLCRSSLLIVVAGLAASVGLTTSATVASRSCRWEPVLQMGSLISGVRGRIAGISAAERDNVWAVGEDDVRSGAQVTRAKPLLAHWDGVRWTVADSPVAWGYVDTVVNAPVGVWATVRTRDGVVLMRWNGTDWRRSPRPADATRVVAGPRGRVWLLGRQVYEWRSGRWRPRPALGLLTVGRTMWPTARSDELWRITNNAAATWAVVERWTGARWLRTPVPLPNDPGPYGSLVAFARADVWLAGSDGDHATLFHWDGVRWTRASGPPSTAVDAHLYRTGTQTLWLAGGLYVHGAYPPYLMRYDGSGWRRVTAPTRTNADDPQIYDVGGEPWAAGMVATDDVLRLSCE